MAVCPCSNKSAQDNSHSTPEEGSHKSKNGSRAKIQYLEQDKIFVHISITVCMAADPASLYACESPIALTYMEPSLDASNEPYRILQALPIRIYNFVKSISHPGIWLLVCSTFQIKIQYHV